MSLASNHLTLLIHPHPTHLQFFISFSCSFLLLRIEMQSTKQTAKYTNILRGEQQHKCFLLFCFSFDQKENFLYIFFCYFIFLFYFQQQQNKKDFPLGLYRISMEQGVNECLWLIFCCCTRGAKIGFFFPLKNDGSLTGDLNGLQRNLFIHLESEIYLLNY